jgi:FKBP-type peptidyl-prolyl cis-trans isomerase
MIKKSLLVVLCAAGLASCLPDEVDSATTQLNKQQEKIIDEYVANNNLTGKKETLYTVNGDYFPLYTMVSVPGDDLTQYKSNEAVWVAYTIKDIQGKVIETKTQADSIIVYPAGLAGKIVGLSWVSTQFLGKGGIGTFIIPSTLGYGSNPPAGVESNSILILDVQVVDRLNETQQIDMYVKKHKLKDYQTTASGLVIAKTKITTDSLVTGATATAKFRGHLITGVEFQPEATSSNMVLAGYIPGFSEALKLMRKGETAVAILPSKLAYGEAGSDRIPGFMPLVFNLELLDNK